MDQLTNSDLKSLEHIVNAYLQGKSVFEESKDESIIQSYINNTKQVLKHLKSDLK